MKNPNIIDATLDLLYATGVEGLPEKDQFLYPHPGEENDRYVIIGEEVLGDELISRGFGGCWPSRSDALDSYDWNAGAPVYMIDLFCEPKDALWDIKLEPAFGPRRSLVDEHGDPVIP
jgi:hypothetical protein